MTTTDDLFGVLVQALRARAEKNGIMDDPVEITCRPLTPQEAIGNPKEKDYPILKGKEAMMEACYRGAEGQAFSDSYGERTVRIRDMVEEIPRTTRRRAEFIAVLNAVYRHLGLCDQTVHCHDQEPVECARDLATRIGPGMQVLVVGLQPRIVEVLQAQNPLRVVDLDPDNVGTEKFGVRIEGPEATEDALKWCHLILATGSTLVNGTLPLFLRQGKPVIFYGVTLAAAASILKLDRYCFKGH
ncbi:MAG: DUF364 domain-containing protein [Planctomycetota bacterium]